MSDPNTDLTATERLNQHRFIGDAELNFTSEEQALLQAAEAEAEEDRPLDLDLGDGHDLDVPVVFSDELPEEESPDCKEAYALERYTYGDVDDNTAERIEEHLRNCSSCRHRHHALREAS